MVRKVKVPPRHALNGLSGIVIDVSPVQSVKAALPMFVTLAVSLLVTAKRMPFCRGLPYTQRMARAVSFMYEGKETEREGREHQQQHIDDPGHESDSG